MGAPPVQSINLLPETALPASGSYTVNWDGTWASLRAVNFAATIAFDGGAPLPFDRRDIWNTSFSAVTIGAQINAVLPQNPTFILLLGNGYPPQFAPERGQIVLARAVSDYALTAGKSGPFPVGTCQTISRLVTLPLGAANAVRVAGSTVGISAGAGVIINPGQTVRLNGNYDLYAYNSGAATLDLSVIEERAGV